MTDEELGKKFREASQMSNAMDYADRERKNLNRTVVMFIALILFIIFFGGCAWMAGWITL